jgi:CBS domain-containing protein
MSEGLEATGVATRVTEIMARNVVSVRPEASVAEVARMLTTNRFTGAPVVDGGGSLVGVVSESDIIGKKGRTVAEIMTPAVYTVDESATLGEVAEMLLTRHIRRVPVTREGRLVGLVSRSDLIGFFATHQWVCSWCGAGESGLIPPAECASCGGEAFRLDSTGEEEKS